MRTLLTRAAARARARARTLTLTLTLTPTLARHAPAPGCAPPRGRHGARVHRCGRGRLLGGSGASGGAAWGGRVVARLDAARTGEPAHVAATDGLDGRSALLGLGGLAGPGLAPRVARTGLTRTARGRHRTRTLTLALTLTLFLTLTRREAAI